jgi:hypothetical protein
MDKEISITLYESEVSKLLELLEEVNAPLKTTRPIYEKIARYIVNEMPSLHREATFKRS